MNSSAVRHPEVFQYMGLISLTKSHKGSLWQSRKLSWGPMQHHCWFYIIIYSVYEVTFIHRSLQTPHLINKSAAAEPNSLAPPHTNPHMASCGSQEITYVLLVSSFVPLI